MAREYPIERTRDIGFKAITKSIRSIGADGHFFKIPLGIARSVGGNLNLSGSYPFTPGDGISKGAGIIPPTAL